MDPHERVLEALQGLRASMEASLRDAVRIRSVNPSYSGVSYREHVGGELEAAESFADLFRRAGAETEVIEFVPGRGNAVGFVAGAGSGRSLAFNGHVDVVPAGDPGLWSHEPFGAECEDDRMFGRGTTDQKAGLIGQAYAAIALKTAGVRLEGDLHLQAVSGEESGEHDVGIAPVLDLRPLPDAAIVSEPSPQSSGSLGVGVASAGLLRFVVRVDGRRAHGTMRGASVHPTSGGSMVGVNAIDKGVLVYHAIRQLEQEWAETKRHSLFANGYFALSPAVARAQADDTPTPATIPNWMTIEYSVIHHPAESPADVRREIETHIAVAARLDPWLRAHPPRVEWSDFEWPPLRTSPDADIVGCLRDSYRKIRGPLVEGVPPATACMGLSHASQFGERGVPAVTFGPSDGVGRNCSAHAPDESVDLDEVFRAAQVYALTAMSWCGVASPLP